MTFLFFEIHPCTLLFGLAIILIFLAIQRRRGRSFPYLLCLFLFSSYLLVLLDVLFLPIRIPAGWPQNITLQGELSLLSHVNFTPFYFGNLFTFSRAIIFWELAGNILLTLPFGFGLPFFVRIPPRRILWVGFLTGLALEAAQLAISLAGMVSHNYGHSVDINDVLLNALGVIVGYALFRWIARLPFLRGYHEGSTSLSNPGI